MNVHIFDSIKGDPAKAKRILQSVPEEIKSIAMGTLEQLNRSNED